MIHIKKENAHYYFWAVITCFFSFCVGYIHHQWFFPLEFHGDSAAMHVLAKAILDQGSLLPADFSYGNQLVFLRSSPFIAIAMFFGLNGLSAFIIGSALSVAFWGIILYFFLSSYLNSNWKGALFSILLLLPLGYWDSDYVLGQQSHLSNAVLSVGLVVSVCLYVTKKSKSFLVAACICLFLMSLESPMRGLLVLAPVLFSLLLLADLRKMLITVFPLGIVFIAAYFFNKLLLQLRPISWNYFDTLSFKSTYEILDNLAKTSRETLGSISSVNIVSEETISLIDFFVFAIGILLIVMYLAFFLSKMFAALKVAMVKLDNPFKSEESINNGNEDIVQLTSVFGLIIGALAVAALNPDSSRHYLWSIFLAKLFVFKWIFDFLSGFIERKKVSIILIGLALLMSSWFAYLVKLNWNIESAIKQRNFTEEVVSIQEISENTGIKNIYGEDFWRMMPLNTLIPNVNAQALLLGDGEVYPYSWLTRPSWSCVEGDVLYYLRNGLVDEKVKKMLIDAGGDLVKNGNGYTLWKGPRVWRLPSNSGCYESSLEYKGNAFLNLPATVGVLIENTRKTDGNAGFLVFGPYSTLKSGEYELSVYGSVDSIDSAYVDVVSDRGNLVHGRFDLEKVVEGPILLKAVVQLTSNVTDIEVRVSVGKNDSLSLVGYSLKPYSKR